VLAASFLLLALVGGIIGTTGGLIRARIAEADAAREAGEKTAALMAAETNEQQAKRAQQEAQANLEDAMAAVDQLLTRLADARLADVPHMEPIRRELLQDALKFYQKFLARKSDDPVIHWEVARSYLRMGRIYDQLGQNNDANEACLKAIAMMEELGAASSRDPAQRSELVNTRIQYTWIEGSDSVGQMRRAVEVAESLVAEFPELPESRATWLIARNGLGGVLTQSQPEEAEKILREILPLADSDRSLQQIHLNLGFLSWSKQRLPEAVKHFRHALEIEEKWVADTPSSPWLQREVGLTLRYLASVLSANQQTAEAEEYEHRAVLIFDKVASDFPAGPQFRSCLASDLTAHAGLLKQLGQTAEAEKAYRRAVDVYEKLAADFPTIPTFRQSAFDQRIELSRFLFQGGRPLEAREMLGKATMVYQKLPDDFAGRLIHKRGLVLCHLELARLLKAGGKTLEAQTAVDQAVAIQQDLEIDFADKPEFRRELAGAHLSAADRLREDGRAEEAERFYHLAEALVAAAPDDVEGSRGLWDAWMWRGDFYRDRNRWRDALPAYAKAVAQNPQRWESWHLRGFVYTRLQEWDQAITDETKAIELNANVWNLWYTRGVAYAGRKEWAKAIEDYDRALALDLNNAGLHHELACLLAHCPDQKVRNPQRAIELARRAVSLDPQNGAFRGTLGSALYRGGSWKAAIEELNASIKLRQHGADMLFLAMALKRLDQDAEARGWYDRAIERMAKNAPKDDEMRRLKDEARALLELKD
jgi:tetratricopeptide (TPR) repeat protein